MGDNQQMMAFLWFSYFGITPDSDYNTKIEKCIERAYRDLNRTIGFTYSQSVLDKKSDQTISEDDRSKYIDAKQRFKSDLIQSIKEKVTKLPEEKGFREWHKALCDEIIKKNPVVDGLGISVLTDSLTYGQAQKWVNMTLKYMWLMGLIEDPNIQKQLCVPIDNYILQQLHGKDVKPFVITKNGNQYRVKQENDETAYPWSKFPDAGFYYGLDEEIKAIIGDKMPLAWENEVWLNSSQPNESEDS